MQEQYAPCDCPECQNLRLNLAKKNDNNKPFESIFNSALKAFQKLFKKGSYSPDELMKTAEYKHLVSQTTSIFNGVISHEVSDDLRKHLEHGNLVFSGLKTHAQLSEARSFLKDEHGHIVPYHQFEQKVLKLNEQYNKNYLQAEYEFAVQSAQSVQAWQHLSDNADRYWLEYRTASDERVRDSHRTLQGVVLPKTDPFWKEFYPPNGWRCRCVAVEVLARENKLSDSKKAIENGKAATSQIGRNGKNKLEMFRFNPALEQTLFPPKNSYTKIVGADTVIATVSAFEEERVEKWETITTEKGILRVSSFHGKNEKQENTEIASYFANKYEHEIDLLRKLEVKKSADAFNKTLGVEQEYKRVKTPTIEAVSKAIRSAKNQADNIVLDIKSDISKGDLRDAISSRVRRSESIKTITIIRNGNDKTYNREDILKEGWEL